MKSLLRPVPIAVLCAVLALIGLAAQLGDAVLALTGDEGDDDLGDVLAYLAPGLAIAPAAAGIALVLVRRRGRCGTRVPTGTRRPAVAHGDRDRLEADMERYDQ